MTTVGEAKEKHGMLLAGGSKYVILIKDKFESGEPDDEPSFHFTVISDGAYTNDTDISTCNGTIKIAWYKAPKEFLTKPEILVE